MAQLACVGQAGRDGVGRRTERRFDAVGVEIKAYGEAIVDGRRTARAAEDWRRALEHERSLGLHWHDRHDIENPQVPDPGASIVEAGRTPRSAGMQISKWRSQLEEAAV